MKRALVACLALLFNGVLAAKAEPAGGTPVSLKATDGTKLAATYYAGEEPGPGILLLHQCNRDRTMWKDVAPALAAKGFHVLTLDYRGYGESGDKPFKEWTAADQREIGGKWPGDVDTAFAYLKSQSGVRADGFGAGGASCGVNQSIQLARRHPEVKSLVLLSGFTDREGRDFLRRSPSIPMLMAAADDDDGAVEQMCWLDAASGNSANQFVRYARGGHGVELFAPHPDLPRDIVAWYEATLSSKGGSAAPPAMAGDAPRPSRDDPRVRLLVMMDEAGGPARAARTLTDERGRNPKSPVLDRGFVNRLGYTAIQAGDTKAAVAIMQVNVDARPGSANAWDSLGDALLADGQREEARAAAEKALSLVDADSSETKEQRALIRQSAEQKLAQLKGSPK
jgi:dienelactone hydrolase